MQSFKTFIQESHGAQLTYTAIFFDKSKIPLPNEVKENLIGKEIGSFKGRSASNEVHQTWSMGPEKYPEGVTYRNDAKVKVVGYYADDNCICLVTEWNGQTKQPNGTPLHISLWSDSKTAPVECGKRCVNKTITIPEFEIFGEWK